MISFFKKVITAGFLAEMITGRECDRRRRALPAMTLILMTAVIAVVAAQERIVGGRQALRAIPGVNQHRWGIML